MKKVRLVITIMCLMGLLAGCGNSISQEEPQQIHPVLDSEEVSPKQEESAQIQRQQEGNDRLETEEMSILMKIDEEIVTVAWEDNEAVEALMELLQKQPLTIQMSMYGGFEQVGSLGTSLPREDTPTTTQAGDIVLYSGNQMVVFYGSNSWDYTRLGKITDKSAEELMDLLGDKDVSITLQLES